MKMTLPCSILAFLASASTLHVPEDYATIQEAILASSDGDTILVSAGAYYESVDFFGKLIVLVSREGPGQTIIQSGGSVVSFMSGEGPQAVLEGFTITGGNAPAGGGVLIVSSSPTIKGNTIAGNLAANTADASGGGIYLEDSNSLVEGNSIVGNGVCCFDPLPHYARGGAVYCTGGSPVFANNRIERNYTSTTWSNVGIAGGVCDYSAAAVFLNNIIAGNYSLSGSAQSGGAGVVSTSGTFVNNTIAGNEDEGINGGATIINSIIADNNDEGGPQIIATGSVLYSDVEGGWPGEGNIDADPLFIVGPMSDYHLDTTMSPCIDAGNPSAGYFDPEDPLNPGLAEWPSLGSIINDMGAYGGQGVCFWADINDDIGPDLEATALSVVPNPTSEAATILVNLPESCKASVRIYDTAGRLMERVFEGTADAGNLLFPIVLQSLSTGIYLIRLDCALGSCSLNLALIR
jgi:parallel beta-helix repeat protein